MIATGEIGDVKVSEKLKVQFESWYEQAFGEIPERGVLCDYIEDEPLMSWIGWKKGYEIGRKESDEIFMYSISVRDRLLNAIEMIMEKQGQILNMNMTDDDLKYIELAISAGKGK